MMRSLVFLHRWIGVVLCLFFAMWFASGIVMMYVRFPALPATERALRSAPLDVAAIHVPLAELLSTAGVDVVDALRLVQRGAHPVLVVEGRDGRGAVLNANDGSRAQPLALDEARAIAERFADAKAAAVAGPFDFDQWVVHQAFDRARPYYRVDLDDDAGTRLYVSQTTGEVVQRTRRTERVWNYVGSVVHWIYPTIIRKHWALWDRLVWWLSLAGILGAGLGIVVGLVRLQDAWRRGKRGLASPFVGWLKWHHVTGLVAAVFVTTWIVSGWLSMDHGRLFSAPDPSESQIDAFRGLTLRAAAAQLPLPLAVDTAGASMIDLGAAAGRAILTVRGTAPPRSYVLEPNRNLRARVLDDSEIAAGVHAAWPDMSIVEVRAVGARDAYGELREGNLPDGTRRVLLGDASATWIHVDPATGKIVSVMDRGRRVYRWLFNGLHSLDFPGLVDRRPLWDIAMIALLAVGFGFSTTGVVIGYRRAIGSRRHSRT